MCKRLVKSLVIGSALLATLSACKQVRVPGPVLASRNAAVVATCYGKVSGYVDDGVFIFKGIPYAKARRFMAPEAPDRWEGIRPARVYGPASPQKRGSRWRGQEDNDFAYAFTRELFDEDSLFTVNVFTKGINDDGKRPVFVWFHGGGFAQGSAINLACYEGSSLARKGDIVVVTVNHRLNCLGFTDLSSYGEQYKYSANAGILDLVASLQWVHDNIAAFGGDPAQVTIAGQSGGGGKVQTLMVCPAAKGLFQRAIVQSGAFGLRMMQSKEAAQAYGRAIVRELGLDETTIDQIHRVPYEELSAAAARAAGNGAMLGGSSPSKDGLVLPYEYFDPEAADLYADIPLLIGSTFNEMGKLYYENPVSEVEAERILAGKYGDKLHAFKAGFRKAYPDASFEDMLSVDTGARNGSIQVADLKYQQGTAPVYLYLFTWKSPVLDGHYASCHNMDLPFMFNNVGRQRELTGGGKDAYVLADRMSGAWIAFTKTGNPNAKGLPKWPAYNPEEHPTLLFDTQCKLAVNHDRQMLEATIN